jgi:hypothetical protein
MNEDFVFIQLKPGTGRAFVADGTLTFELKEGDQPLKVTVGEWHVVLNKTGLFQEVSGNQPAAIAKRETQG